MEEIIFKLQKQKNLNLTTEVFKFWSGKRDSNSRPQPWQGCALPTELFPQYATNYKQEKSVVKLF